MDFPLQTGFGAMTTGASRTNSRNTALLAARGGVPDGAASGQEESGNKGRQKIRDQQVR
jgi:hypothetical protein